MNNQIISWISYGLWAILAGVIFWGDYSFTKYLKEYQIFRLLWAKLLHRGEEIDTIQRKNIHKTTRFFTVNEKKPLLNNFYQDVTQSGILEKYPGFSESLFMGGLFAIAFLVFLITAVVKRKLVLGIILFAAIIFIVRYIIHNLAMQKKANMENQLLQFVNLCAASSGQYNDIIGIMNVVWPELTGGFSKDVRTCSIEGNQPGKKNIALEHLKHKYDSTIFSFVIDSLAESEKYTGDIAATLNLLSTQIEDYSRVQKEITANIRGSKITIVILAVCCVAILAMIMSFFGTSFSFFTNSVVGNVFLFLYIVIFAFGMAIKAN